LQRRVFQARLLAHPAQRLSQFLRLFFRDFLLLARDVRLRPFVEIFHEERDEAPRHRQHQRHQQPRHHRVAPHPLGGPLPPPHPPPHPPHHRVAPPPRGAPPPPPHRTRPDRLAFLPAAQVRRQLFGAGVTLRRFLPQTLQRDRLQIARRSRLQPAGRNGVVVEHLLQGGRHRRPAERRAARQALVQHRPHPEDAPRLP